MKLSAMTYSFSLHDGGVNAFRYPEMISNMGLQGINWVFGYGLTPTEITEITWNAGLQVSCFTCAVKSFVQGRDEKECLDEAEQYVRYAHAIGAKTMMMVPMALPYAENRTDARKKWINFLQKIIPYSIENNVVLTIETLCGAQSPVVTAADLSEVLKEVPGLRVTFDAGNTLTAEDPLKTLELIYDKIEFVHLKDWIYAASGDTDGVSDGLSGKMYAPVPPGEGLLDIGSLLTRLHEFGYNGWLDIEYAGPLPPEIAVRRSASIIQNKFAEFIEKI